MHSLFYLISLLSIFTLVKTANILGVFPSPGYSQFILGEKLLTELARRGHNVTVISAYMPREQLNNYRTILTDGLIKGPERNLFLREQESYFSRIKSVHNLGSHLTEYTLSHPDVQNLLRSNETFDLVLLEQFGNEAHMGFGSHFDAPVVLFSSIGLSEWNSHLMGDIRLPSIVPVTKTAYTDHMTFFQRLVNTFVNLCDRVYKKFVSYPQQQKYLDKYFPKRINLMGIMYNASLMLLNSHVSITQPTSLTNAVVEIGGFHISLQKLPTDIQKFLDDAADGAILFSMGTNLKISNLPPETLDAIMQVFSKLKQSVLWRFEESDIPNKPKNLLISKWLPQSDVLAHPNVVGFITHGGLLSVTEAVFYGVPMVGIPVFGDQRINVARCVQKGIAVHIPLPKLNKYTLHEALIEVLENPKYRKSAKKYSDILRDQVVKPLDLAMYWVEYVIKHKGADHLRNASLELNWFQLYSIDVLIFVILCVVLLLDITIKLLKKMGIIKGTQYTITCNVKLKENKQKAH